MATADENEIVKSWWSSTNVAPLWLVLYGLPGSGKTTLIQRVQQHLPDHEIFVLGKDLISSKRVNELMQDMNKESYLFQVELLEEYATQLMNVPSPQDKRLIVIEEIPLYMIHHYSFTHVNWTRTLSHHGYERLQRLENRIHEKRRSTIAQFSVVRMTIDCTVERALQNLRKREPNIFSPRNVQQGKRNGTFNHLLQHVHSLLENQRWETVTLKYNTDVDISDVVVDYLLKQEVRNVQSLFDYMQAVNPNQKHSPLVVKANEPAPATMTMTQEENQLKPSADAECEMAQE